MGPNGVIVDYSDLLKMSEKDQKKFIPIPQAQFDEVYKMNRADRRAWYRKNKNKD